MAAAQDPSDGAGSIAQVLVGDMVVARDSSGIGVEEGTGEAVVSSLSEGPDVEATAVCSLSLLLSEDESEAGLGCVNSLRCI